MAILLADAYTWGKSVVEVQADPTPNDRARMVLEAVLERDPDNMLARIKLTDLQTVTASFAETLEARTRDLQLACGGPWEPLALLHLARVYVPRGRHEEALRYYDEMIALEPRLAGVAYLEMGVSYYMYGALDEAIASLKKAVQFLEEQSSKVLEHYLQSLAGRVYAEFWKSDQRLSDLFYAQSWLAGLYMKKQEKELARAHLNNAIKVLNRKGLRARRPVLVKALLQLAQGPLPELAEEPAVQRLQARQDRVGKG